MCFTCDQPSKQKINLFRVSVILIENQKIQRIIQHSWSQKPQERLKINDIVSLLETIQLNENKYL